MAKKTIQSTVNQYTDREAAVRKAKGNPNKNVHQKKGNSNYGGYTTGAYLADKVKKKVAEQEHVKLPTWMKVGLGVLLGALIVLLILRLTVLKENLTVSYVSTLLLGLSCAAIFYIRRYKHEKKSGALYKVITVILAVCAVLYTVLGVGGLLTLAGLIQ